MKIVMAEEFNGQLWIRADMLQATIKEAVEKEREVCAKLCEKENEEWGWDAHVLDVADAIRARGQA